MRFAGPEYLYWMLAVPLILAAGIMAMIRRRIIVREIADSDLFTRICPETSKEREILRLVLTILAYIALVVALARPQFGTHSRLLKRRGVDVVVALDTSKSMLAFDVSPLRNLGGNRLNRARLEINGLIDRLEGDRIGLVAFSGAAFVQCPLTSDYAAAKLLLRAMDAGSIPVGGTRFEEALRLSRHVFENSRGGSRSKVLVLISDGEDHEGGYEQELTRLVQMGVVIHTVGVGSASGELIPQPDGTYMRKRGQWIMTYLRESSLRALAEISGGTYVHSAAGDLGFEVIYDMISQMHRSEYEFRIESVYEEQYQLFAGIGFLFLIGATLVPHRREI